MKGAKRHALTEVLVVQNRDAVIAVREVFKNGRDLTRIVGLDGNRLNDSAAIPRKALGLVVEADQDLTLCIAEVGNHNRDVAGGG